MANHRVSISHVLLIGVIANDGYLVVNRWSSRKLITVANIMA